MRTKTKLLQIEDGNGNWLDMYAPDEDMSFDYEDIDSPDTGRTEDGVMHRTPVRYKVQKFGFSYATLTDAEFNEIEDMFRDVPTFKFKHPKRGKMGSTNPDDMEISTCYRSKSSISWRRNGLWKNYSFNIIEC